MVDDRTARIAHFNAVLGTTSDKFLLDTAEAAGRNGGGYQAAVTAIATAVGLPFSLFDSSLQIALQGMILARLQSLRTIARSQSYSWIY